MVSASVSPFSRRLHERASTALDGMGPRNDRDYKRRWAANLLGPCTKESSDVPDPLDLRCDSPPPLPPLPSPPSSPRCDDYEPPQVVPSPPLVCILLQEELLSFDQREECSAISCQATPFPALSECESFIPDIRKHSQSLHRERSFWHDDFSMEQAIVFDSDDVLFPKHTQRRMPLCYRPSTPEFSHDPMRLCRIHVPSLPYGGLYSPSIR